MKKAALRIAHSIPRTLAQAVDPDRTIEDNNSVRHTRFWDYYNPYPSNYIGSREWWDGETLTGDWWGMRNMLDDDGVEVVANYTTNSRRQSGGWHECGLHLHG